jgi:hypothetical protein
MFAIPPTDEKLLRTESHPWNEGEQIMQRNQSSGLPVIVLMMNRSLSDIVAQEHWCSGGFSNTDLELQLKRHGIQRLLLSFQNQRTDQHFQCCTVLRWVVQLRTHNVRLL